MTSVAVDSLHGPLDRSALDTPPDAVKVLHLINGDLYAGAERVQDLLALRLGEFGYEVGFATLKQGRFANDRRSQATPLFDTCMRSRFDVTVARRIADVICGERYRLIHTHTPRTALVGRVAASLAGVPHVHHLHSPASAETKKAWRNRANAWVERIGVQRAAEFIAVSNSVAQHARNDKLGRAQVSVVHNGVPVLGPLEDRLSPSDEWTLSMAALFRPRKGLEVLLEALAILRGVGHHVRLRAIGSFHTPEYQAEIRDLADRLHLEPSVDWVGFSRDVIGEMRQSDLFVLPSLFGEGLPMVVLEAMSAGVPVVATRVEGTPEAVRDGIDGLLAAPNNAEELAATIRRVLTREVDWSSLRQSAHARQAEHFSDFSMAAGVARVYDSLFAHRSSNG